MNSENLLYNIEPTAFDKEIDLPTSKSHANRALIIGAIKGNGFRVDHLPESTDVTSLIACLKTIGLNVTIENQSAIFHNSFPACEAETQDLSIDLKTGDGGTTNRFLMALLSRGKKRYQLFPTEKMSERPIEDLLVPLKNLLVDIELNIHGAWVSLQGPAQVVNSTKLEIDCQKSTQFASAMMLAFTGLPLSFDLKNINASEVYIEMTKAILKETADKNTYRVPVDFSSLGYPLALALLKGRVLIKNCLELDPLQPDSQLIALMQDCGAHIEWTAGGLLATCRNTLKPFRVDGSIFPDLIPTLVFLASHINGKSVIKNLKILRHKESDRLEQLITLLNQFSIPFHFDEACDEMSIEGSSELRAFAGTLLPARDHRMVMTSYLFLRANRGGRVSEIDCVEKSFPHFFTILA